MIFVFGGFLHIALFVLACYMNRLCVIDCKKNHKQESHWDGMFLVISSIPLIGMIMLILSICMDISNMSPIPQIQKLLDYVNAKDVQ